jgi:hypothetical protein
MLWVNPFSNDGRPDYCRHPHTPAPARTGSKRAIREWLQRNYLVWAPEDIEDADDEDTNGTNTAGSASPTRSA